MQVENHKEEAPFAHYAELFRNLNPAAVTARLSDVRWKEFTLSLLGRAFAIAHPDYAIRALDGGALPPLPSQTFLLRYLLESKDVVWQGQWKTFREMPWGEMYIKPYTGRVLTRAAFTFGTQVPAFAAACERAILARLRSMTPAEFDALDTGHEGVGQRLYNASRNAATLDAVLDNAKTKRYAYARLRRMVLWAYLGLTPAKLPASVPYLRVLAANEIGRALLGRMRKTARLPVITKPAAIRSLSPDAQRLFVTESRAADLYALAYPELTEACGSLWRQNPVMP